MATNTSHYNLVKPAYTESADIDVINGNMGIIDSALDDHDTALDNVENSIAIVSTGNTHAAITSGQYVYVREHTALTDGLYVASANIAANATLSSSNLTAVPSGGMNALKASVDTLSSNIGTIQNKIMINEAANTSAYRNVWFSDSNDDLRRVHDADFQYNPGTNDLKIGTINGKTVKDITIKNYNVELDAWSAGTIGTRAIQKSVSLASDVSTYGTILSFSLVYVADSNAAHCQVFMTSGNSTLYVNAYRANAVAYTAASTFLVTVRVVYAK